MPVKLAYKLSHRVLHPGIIPVIEHLAQIINAALYSLASLKVVRNLEKCLKQQKIRNSAIFWPR